MGCPVPLPNNWRDYVTDDERSLQNRLSMWGSDCISKVGKRFWDSGVPGAPLFKTKTAAHDYLETFVCDMIHLRCVERIARGEKPARQ